MMGRTVPRVLAACALMATVPFAARSSPLAVRRSPLATVWDSVYSLPQAARGETAYAKFCARCHQASLGGADQSPPLVGGGFLGNWNAMPLSDLQERIRSTMPPDSIGLVDRQVVTDVMAYMLKVNAFPAGAADLPVEQDRLKAILIASKPPSF